MNRLYRVYPRARRDLERLFNWLEQRSPSGAQNWTHAYLSTIDAIRANPDSFPVMTEARPRWKRNLREALFHTRRGRTYRILFELTDSEIRVLRFRGPGQPPVRRRDLPDTD